jgi:hypothetical protein
MRIGHLQFDTDKVVGHKDYPAAKISFPPLLYGLPDVKNGLLQIGVLQHYCNVCPGCLWLGKHMSLASRPPHMQYAI